MVKRCIGLILALLLAGLLLAGCQKGPGDLAVYGVNTGKSDCLLFRLPNGETLLVDTGLKDTYPTLKAMLTLAGVKRIDHLVITHGHKDHIGGLKQLAQDFKISTVYTNAYDTATYSDKERELLALCAGSWKKLRPAGANASLLLGGVRAEFPAPSRAYSDAEDDNNNSLVLRLTHGEVVFLLMGDATSLIEEDLLGRYPPEEGAGGYLRADFLKAGRHGKADANTQAFIGAVAPKVVYITGSRAEDPDSPDEAVLLRYAAAEAEVFTNEGAHLALMWRSDGASLSAGEPIHID